MNNDVTIELGKTEELCIHQGHEETGWRITLPTPVSMPWKAPGLRRYRSTSKQIPLWYLWRWRRRYRSPCTLDFHRSHGAMATLTALILLLDLVNWKWLAIVSSPFVKNQKEVTVSLMAGTLSLRKKFWLLTEDDSCDLEIGALERIANEGQLMVYRHPGSGLHGYTERYGLLE